MLIVGIDSTILNVALPSIALDLHAASSELVWINAAYIIMYGSTILLSGTLGDRFGRKTLLLSRMTLFRRGVADRPDQMEPIIAGLILISLLAPESKDATERSTAGGPARCQRGRRRASRPWPRAPRGSWRAAGAVLHHVATLAAQPQPISGRASLGFALIGVIARTSGRRRTDMGGVTRRSAL